MQCKSCGCTIAGASPEICPVCGKETSGTSAGVAGVGGNTILPKVLGVIALLVAAVVVIYVVI